jgi:hypothetical protein
MAVSAREIHSRNRKRQNLLFSDLLESAVERVLTVHKLPTNSVSSGFSAGCAGRRIRFGTSCSCVRAE